MIAPAWKKAFEKTAASSDVELIVDSRTFDRSIEWRAGGKTGLRGDELLSFLEAEELPHDFRDYGDLSKPAIELSPKQEAKLRDIAKKGLTITINKSGKVKVS